MKKIYFLILILNAPNIESFAQAYQPFPASNTRWSEEGYYANFGIGDTTHTYYGYAYSLGYDTLIQGKHYTLLGEQATWLYVTQMESLEVYTVNYPLNSPGQIIGAIREDSSRRVWFKKLASDLDIATCYRTYFLPDDTEILLYDFNLEVGDSIHWTSIDYYPEKHVMAIDSIQFEDGIWRKRYRMWPFGEYWIEGIGSTLGLFGFPTVAPYCWLNCFWNNGQHDIIMQQSNNVYCDSVTAPVGVAEVGSFIFDFSLSPNPATTQLQITFPSTTQPQRLKLINTLGQTIQQQTFFTNQLQLDLSALPSGVYFIELQNEQEKAIKKFVKE